MLGNILGALTDAASAEEALAAIGDPGVVEHVRRCAAAEGVGIGAFVASTVRQMLDYAEEDVWLALLGRMSGSPRPGVAALEAMLARAFPAPSARPRRRDMRGFKCMMWLTGSAESTINSTAFSAADPITANTFRPPIDASIFSTALQLRSASCRPHDQCIANRPPCR